MKHIFLNLKRFDISPEKGGVNRAAIKYNMNRNDIHSLANRLYRPIIRTSAQKRSFNGSQTFVGETLTQSWSFFR